MTIDRDLRLLLGGVLVLLLIASTVGAILRRRVTSDGGRATVANLVARINAWWVMVVVFAAALVLGPTGTVVLYAILSFLALREFITLTPTGRGDHATLFWSFFVVLPLQYVLVGYRWYGLFAILIPVYAFLFVPTRSALAGDTAHFLERMAKIQWGLMIAVYCLSPRAGAAHAAGGRATRRAAPSSCSSWCWSSSSPTSCSTSGASSSAATGSRRG